MSEEQLSHFASHGGGAGRTLHGIPRLHYSGSDDGIKPVRVHVHDRRRSSSPQRKRQQSDNAQKATRKPPAPLPPKRTWARGCLSGSLPAHALMFSSPAH